MKTNVKLIEEIKTLRTEVHKLDTKLKKDKNEYKDLKRSQQELMQRNRDPLMQPLTGRTENQEEMQGLNRESDAKARYIQQLKEQIERAKQEAEDLERELNYAN